MNPPSLQISPTVLREAKSLEIAARRRLIHSVSGLYTSIVRGQGLEFRELADYEIGDDSRSIDWKASARSHRVLKKVFDEERKRQVMIGLDRSSSMSVPRARDLWTHLVAVLALSAIYGGDSVGFARVSPSFDGVVPPSTRYAQFYRIMGEALVDLPLRSVTDLSGGLTGLGRRLVRPGILFLISDFLSHDFVDSVRTLSVRHEVICCVIDPLVILPPRGLVAFEDAETGASLLLDCGSRRVREEFRRTRLSRIETTQGVLRSAGAESVLIESDVLTPLLSLMHRRLARAV